MWYVIYELNIKEQHDGWIPAINNNNGWKNIQYP